MQFQQVGGNFVGWDLGDRGATFRVGAALSVGNSDLEVDGTRAKVDLEDTGLAPTATYQGADGCHIDAVAQGTR